MLQVNERGFSALHFASSSRQGALCQELLLTHGAHINMQVCAHVDTLSYECKIKIRLITNRVAVVV